MSILFAEAVSIFKLKCVSCRQQINGFCFLICPVSMCLLIGELRSLIFKVLIEIYVVTIVLFIFSDCALRGTLCSNDYIFIFPSQSLCYAHSSLQPKYLFLYFLYVWIVGYTFLCCLFCGKFFLFQLWQIVFLGRSSARSR